MNVFSYVLAEGDVQPRPEIASTKFVIDDNIGESVHIHYRNTRIELSVDDFKKFATNVNRAQERLKDGNN